MGVGNAPEGVSGVDEDENGGEGALEEGVEGGVVDGTDLYATLEFGLVVA